MFAHASHTSKILIAAMLAAVWLHAPCGLADDVDATEAAAAKLLASTVTVRIAAQQGQQQPPANKQNGSPAGVTVCSGVSLGNRLVVTFSRAAGSRFRVTLPDGEQSEAEPRVFDSYSGLVLLEIDRDGPPGLQPADRLPAVGGAVLTAAASGIEKPVVSLGILGATNRSIGGTGLPPLLQCDVRTTETSSGAPVVDRDGRLIGIVAATPSEPGGWTYAVGVRHVQRLLRVRPETGYRTLRRQRPSVGLTMRAGRARGSVEVERVEPGGPADRAGVRRGDSVLEVEGRKIRSPYQAVALIIRRQPGDSIELVVKQSSGKTKKVTVTLGGAVEFAPLPWEAADRKVNVGPQLEVRATGRNQIQLRRQGRVEEISVSPGRTAARLPRDEVSMLRVQLAAFEKVILQLQAELDRRDVAHAKTQELIKTLTQEVSRLRKLLDSTMKP